MDKSNHVKKALIWLHQTDQTCKTISALAKEFQIMADKMPEWQPCGCLVLVWLLFSDVSRIWGWKADWYRAGDGLRRDKWRLIAGQTASMSQFLVGKDAEDLQKWH